MRIMMSGPSSTGKTTLAQKLSSRLGLPLVANTARRAGLQMGIKPGDIRDFDTLLNFQETTAAIMLMDFINADEFVSDRCPSDILGYTSLGFKKLIEILGETPTKQHLSRMYTLRDTCKEMIFLHEPDLLAVFPMETPFQNDGFRFGGDPEQRQTESHYLMESWQEFIPAHVPVLMVRGDVEDRFHQVAWALREGKTAYDGIQLPRPFLVRVPLA